jgi:glycosyltransferase involved in cell wall biosynthesis
MNPKIAVIIPCYNYGMYVEESVNSVLASTYKNIDIIIVDDGSTDIYTLSVLDKLKKREKLKVVRRENGGLSAARNTGILLTEAPYILLLDSDDLIDPSFIEKGIQILERNIDYAYVYPLVQLFGKQNKLWRTLPFNSFYLKFRNYIPATIIMRRSVWKEVGGYDEEMREGYEDWEFLIRLSKRGFKGFHINEVLFFYRKHPESMLAGSKRKHRRLFKKIRSKHQDLYKFYYTQFFCFLLVELVRRVKDFLGDAISRKNFID